MNRWRSVTSVVSVGLYVLLWAPLVVVVVFSFNASKLGVSWGGFTLDGYVALGRNEAALAAARNTAVLALLSTALSTVIGTLLGYGLSRGGGKGRRGLGRDVWVDRMLQVPVLVPDVVFAVALVLGFAAARLWLWFLEPGLPLMVLGQVSFQIPFVALVVRARARRLDPRWEEAARDLGATPAAAFFRVTLPMLRPGVVAGALLALTLSLDDFAVSFFLSGPGSTTLPVLIYSNARRGLTPDIHALSTLLLAGTMAAVLLGGWWRPRSQSRTH
ncbi:MAG: ABC transporter permease [Verrucomicrobiales bacterium]|nr:ABC transporter permease [Verrucomicrobiales bacterium]